MPEKYDVDDDDDRPRKKRLDDDYDDDDDAPRIKKSRKDRGFFDKTFADTSIVVLILFGFCCGWVALILAIIGVVTCQDEKARRNATIVLVVSIVMVILSFIFGFMQGMMGAMRK